MNSEFGVRCGGLTFKGQDMLNRSERLIGGKVYRIGAFYRPAHPTPGMGPVEFKGLDGDRVIYRQRGKVADRTCAASYWPLWVGEEWTAERRAER